MIDLIGFSVVAALVQLGMLWYGGASVSPALVGIVLAQSLTITGAGLLALQSVGNPLKARGPGAIVVGYGIVAILLMGLSLTVGLTPLAAFALCAGLVGAGAMLLRRAGTAGTYAEFRRHDLLFACGLALVICGVGASVIGASRTLFESGHLPAWSDYFIHGVTIAEFGSPFALGGDSMLVGAPRVFYHYASFLLPAAIMQTTGTPGLTLATANLLPKGLWIGGLGLYVMVTQIAGRRGALASVAVLLVAPVLENALLPFGWFDYPWLLFTAPGSGYSIGLCLTAVALLHAGLSPRHWRILALAALILLSVILVRVHMFMLAAPAFLATALYGLSRWSRALVLWGTVASALLLAAALAFVPVVHEAWLLFANPLTYLADAAKGHAGYQAYFAHASATGFWPSAVQLGLVLLGSLGVWLFLMPLLASIRFRRPPVTAVDWFPIFLVLTYVALILLAPPAANGDLGEYKHRHFVLLYTAIAGFSIAWAAQLAPRRLAPRLGLPSVAVACVLAALAVGLATATKPIAAPDTRTMPWAAEYFDVAVDDGLVKTAFFIKEHARAGDVIAYDPAAARSDYGQSGELASISGVPVYLARAELKRLRSPCIAALVDRRLAVIDSVASATHWAAAKAQLRDAGVRWFVTFGARASWDSDRANAAFSSGTVSVYDAETAPHALSEWRAC
jgi:hypothetical protein